MGRNTRAFAISMLCGLLGVIFAIMVGILNSAGIIIDEFITGTITIRELQAVIVIIWVIFGIGVSAVKN